MLFSEFGLTGQSLTGVGHKSRFSATSAAASCVGNVRKKGRAKNDYSAWPDEGRLETHMSENYNNRRGSQ